MCVWVGGMGGGLVCACPREQFRLSVETGNSVSRVTVISEKGNFRIEVFYCVTPKHFLIYVYTPTSASAEVTNEGTNPSTHPCAFTACMGVTPLFLSRLLNRHFYRYGS